MNKFPKGSFEYEKRHEFIKMIDESFPHRKSGHKGMQYREVLINAENHIDELVKMFIKEDFWNIYGVEQEL